MPDARMVRSGYRVWYDASDMGFDLKGSMVEGIARSKVVVVCLNRFYMTRPNCLFELQQAYDMGKTIMLLAIEARVPSIDFCISSVSPTALR